MKYLEIRKAVTALLRGDNSKADEYLKTDDSYLKMAMRDIMVRCVPNALCEDWDETKTDVFRRIASKEDPYILSYKHRYIREPVCLIEDDSVIDIDMELTQALVFFMCEYLNNKKNINYVKKAEIVINLYESTVIDQEKFDDYEL